MIVYETQNSRTSRSSQIVVSKDTGVGSGRSRPTPPLRHVPVHRPSTSHRRSTRSRTVGLNGKTMRRNREDDGNPGGCSLVVIPPFRSNTKPS